MEKASEPDLMVPAQRRSDVVVPRPAPGLNDVADLVGLSDAVALSDARVAPLTHTSDVDLARVPRSVLLVAEIVAAVAVGVLAGVLMVLPLVAVALVIGLTLIVHYYSGVEAIRPGMPRLTRLLRDTAIPFAAVAVAVGFLGADPALLQGSGVVVVAVTSAAAVASVVRRRYVGPVRLVVMGDAPDIVRTATQYAGDRRAKVVGGVVVGEHAEIPAGAESILSAPLVRDGADVPGWIGERDADVVVVVPGPRVSNERVQELGWQLEGGPAAISMLSPLAHVAPHRVEAVSFADTTLIHVGSTRPSAFVRGLKSLFDRVVGTLLLALATPLLLALVVAIRLDSRGPGLFRQTRVGKDGAEFTMYKLRTMRRDAEQIKASLAEHNEGAGLLFKLKDDPRITRVGSFLRRSSLDELPQLINVVKGQMSLVGPRPALPEEVAEYDARERRRLAVPPGMTGLWQVSGRSNLSWEKSIELDLHYTDNWRLVDDLGIGSKTAGAVVKSKGAY